MPSLWRFCGESTSLDFLASKGYSLSLYEASLFLFKDSNIKLRASPGYITSSSPSFIFKAPCASKDSPPDHRIISLRSGYLGSRFHPTCSLNSFFPCHLACQRVGSQTGNIFTDHYFAYYKSLLLVTKILAIL